MKEKESEWEDRLDKMGESLNKFMKGLEGLGGCGRDQV